VRSLSSGIISQVRERVLVAADGHGGGKEQNDGEREERRPLHASCVDGYALGNVATTYSMLCARLGV